MSPMASEAGTSKQQQGSGLFASPLAQFAKRIDKSTFLKKFAALEIISDEPTTTLI